MADVSPFERVPLMNTLRWLRVVPWFVAGVGCSSASSLDALRAESSSVASVEFTNAGSGPNTPPAADVAVDDRAKAEALYTAILALPSPPSSGTFSCGADFGITFHFVFRNQAKATVATAVVDAGGCGEVSVATPGGTAVGLWVRGLGASAYTHALEDALGVSTSQLDAWALPANFPGVDQPDASAPPADGARVGSDARE